MESTFLPSPSHENWRALYRAAILETNKTHILQKLSTAEQAILARGRELFYTAGTREEMEALEEALYALRVFRSAWERTEAA
jgi:hypothetical protein